MCRPSHPRWHRDACGARAGASQRTARPLQRGQAEQVLWHEFCNHNTLLNNALNEALLIHGGPAWRIFQVYVLSVGFWSFSPLVSPAFVLFLTQFLPRLVR
jgi:hypothetical protein